MRALGRYGKHTCKGQVGPRRKEEAGGAGARGLSQSEEVLLEAEGDVARGQRQLGERGVRPNPPGKEGHLSEEVLGARIRGNR